MASYTRNRINKDFRGIRSLIETAVTPFGKCTASQKRKRKEKTVKRIKDFALTYFPHYLTDKMSPMHEALYARYQEIIFKAEASGWGSKEVHAAPRGNAKSTLSTLIFPLWCVIGKRRRFIAIISDTAEQSQEFLDSIKAELEANDRLREDFPDICGEGRTWKMGQIVTRNDIKIKCWGKRKRLRGARFGSRRPDLIICDDLENDENVDSPEQREKDRKWFFKAVMKIGARYTAFIVIGTILHYDSLLARLLHQPGWTGKKWKAVIRWSASPLWEKWENIFTTRDEKAADEFFLANETEMLKGTRVLWPEGESYYYLMKMRVSDGPAFFDSEKQNEPIDPNDRLFNEDWFVFAEEEEIAGFLAGGKYREVCCAVDPSMGGASRKADPSAILVGGVRANGVIDILEADIRKRHPDAIMEDLFAIHERYALDRIVIEEVQFQELFKDQVIREGAKRGVYLPVEGVRPNTDKTLRISKLQPHIKNGLIRFRRNQSILTEQLRYFPKADHDDGPDALEMLFSLIARQGNGPRIRRVL
ncbi:MAG: phage terminase large subunit [Nitrospinae bacterium]|nr:phage terminase large subunit [Nitrospinota bacterium]